MNALASPLLRRVLALLILAACAAVLWSYVAMPLIDLASARQADIAGAAERLRHLDALIARQPELDRRASVLGARFAQAGGFWSGPSAAVIAADVEDRLRRVVVLSGGRVESSAEVAATTEVGDRRLAVHFEITGPLATVQRTLAAVDAETPALFVDHLAITAPAAAPDPAHPPTLDLDLTVTGYRPPLPVQGRHS